MVPSGLALNPLTPFTVAWNTMKRLSGPETVNHGIQKSAVVGDPLDNASTNFSLSGSGGLINRGVGIDRNSDACTEVPAPEVPGIAIGSNV